MELNYLEIEITEFCNLNCRGCCDCSNLATEKRFYELDEYKRDLSRMREIFDSVGKIRLMGGEPFLNPHIADYAHFAKELFPNCDLRIVTNGTLIPKTELSLLTELKKAGSYLDISSYPPTRSLRRQIKRRLSAVGIGYNFGPPMLFFFKNFLDKPKPSGEKSFSNCVFSHCHMLGHGRLAPCSFAYCAVRLNERFGTNYPDNDVVNIYSDVNAEEIIQRFNKAHEFCRYCTPGMVPIRWRGGVTNTKAKLNDWVVRRDSLITKGFTVLQSVAKSPAKLMRKIMQRKR